MLPVYVMLFIILAACPYACVGVAPACRQAGSCTAYLYSTFIEAVLKRNIFFILGYLW